MPRSTARRSGAGLLQPAFLLGRPRRLTALLAIALFVSAPWSAGLAQQMPSPSFLQGEVDRQTMENWFNGLTGDFHAGAEYWAAQRNMPQPGSCYGPGGANLGAYTDGCVAAQQRLGPIDQRRKSDPDYRAGWNVQPPAAATAQAAPTPAPPDNSAPPPPTSNFTPNVQGVDFIKALAKVDGRAFFNGEKSWFVYQPSPDPSNMSAFDQDIDQQIDNWMHSGTAPRFASDPAGLKSLFAFYWAGTKLPATSLCLATPRSDDCDMATLEEMGNLSANADFVSQYRDAERPLGLPPLN